MLLDTYYSERNNGIHFSREQASAFAKDIAGDFNPIHNNDSTRFCVPGDLLFSLVLKKYGLYQNMCFTFQGMVNDDCVIIFPQTAAPEFAICDEKNREYLTVSRYGDSTNEASVISDLTAAYVAFSGQTFPHILVPLMTDHQVMINPERPLVVYKSMIIELNQLEFRQPTLELTNASLEVDGKRGNAKLEFQLIANGKPIGRGEKNMVLSGIRPLEEEKLQQLVDSYNSSKQSYKS